MADLYPKFDTSHSQIEQPEEKLSRSNQGREFQAKLTENFLSRFKEWTSVRIRDSRGRAINSAADINYGRDLGIDLFIEIRSDLPNHIQKAVETKLIKILSNERF